MFYQFGLMKIVYVYFFYGLSFFVMGLAILLQDMQFREIALIRDIRWLGVFGVIHGLAEWAVMFTTVKYFMGIPANLLTKDYMGEVIVYSISFAVLYEFGIRTIIATTRQLRWLQYVLLGTGLLWVINWGMMSMMANGDLVLWLGKTEQWSRYLMCFPGSILAGVGFLLIRNQLAATGIPAGKTAVFGTSFIFYGLVAGLSALNSSFFPSYGINLKSINTLAVVTIPLLRSLAGVVMAYYTIRVVGVFNHEYTKLLKNKERAQVLDDERDRISRNLHDGVIQSLYAIGLQMEEAAHLIRESPEAAKDLLLQVIKWTDGVIRDIRFFIQDLRLSQGYEGNLAKRLKFHLSNFSSVTRLPVEFSGPGEQFASKLTPEQSDHLYYIVQEALMNVAKHADASQIYVDLAAGHNQLHLSIIDDGRGMRENPCDMVPLAGHGMANIRARVKLLNGRCQWESNPGLGTRLQIVIPIGNGGQM